MPRRLLMTTDAVGGVWRYALDLAQGLSGLGVETTLLGFGPRPSAGQRAEAERCASLVWSDLPLDWTAGDAAELDRVPEVVAREAAAAGADIVQVNVPSQAAGLALDIPVVAAAHSCVTSWFRVVLGSDLPERLGWQRRLMLQGLSRADAVVAPSAAFGRLLAECYPGLGPVSVVPNATGMRPSRVRRQPYAYAAARWWDEGKDAATLDEAARLAGCPLHAAGATVGPGGERVEFRHARPAGQLDRVRLVDLAGAASAFVSPSRYEPFGLAALEAARLGTALVLSDIPTYREIWDGVALFAEPQDARGFAAALDRVMADPGLQATLAARAAERSGRYTLAAQAERMADIYGQVAPARDTAKAS